MSNYNKARTRFIQDVGRISETDGLFKVPYNVVAKIVQDTLYTLEKELECSDIEKEGIERILVIIKSGVGRKTQLP